MGRGRTRGRVARLVARLARARRPPAPPAPAFAGVGVDKMSPP
jgi:hypothetical protein